MRAREEKTDASSARQWGLPPVVARFTARIVYSLLRRLGRGGTSLPGKVYLYLSPRGLSAVRNRSKAQHVVLVSATNGKTTTCALIAGMAEAAGLRVAHNMAGANLRSGIATTLLRAPRDVDVLLLETDEATLPRVAKDLRPTVVVLGNLFRDQLDRFGELETLADGWATALNDLHDEGTTVVAAADDPLIASLVQDWAEKETAPKLVMFAMVDTSVAVDGFPHAADSTTCRRCGTPLNFQHTWVGHLGDWSCPGCGFHRPIAAVRAAHVELEGLAATRISIEIEDHTTITGKLRVPGLYNAYNALAATAAATAFGIDAAHIETGINDFSPAFGRFERIPVPQGGSLTLLLVKNPTGLTEVTRTLVTSGVDLTATLFALNDGIADGRDTSWIWDAELEPLLKSTPSGIVATGDRSAEFALRAVYGGADLESITIEPDLERAMFEVLERGRLLTQHGHAYALVTYTAMLSLRAIATRLGWTDAFWQERQRLTTGGES